MTGILRRKDISIRFSDMEEQGQHRAHDTAKTHDQNGIPFEFAQSDESCEKQNGAGPVNMREHEGLLIQYNHIENR